MKFRYFFSYFQIFENLIFHSLIFLKKIKLLEFSFDEILNYLFSLGNSKEVLLEESMPTLRDIWNETSYQLELLQANPHCVSQEQKSFQHRTGLKYKLSFTISEGILSF